jgi:hypothetical protein
MPLLSNSNKEQYKRGEIPSWMACAMPLIYCWSGLCTAGSRLQSRISAHAIRGLDAETMPFRCRHLSPSDLTENACDGNFYARKVTWPANSHRPSPRLHFTDVIPARDIQTFLYFRKLASWAVSPSQASWQSKGQLFK